MAEIRTKLKPSGQMKLSMTFLALAGLGVCLIIAALAWAQQKVPSVGTLLARKEPEPMRKVDMPDRLKPPAEPYKKEEPKPQPPVAQPVVRPTAPVVQQAPVPAPVQLAQAQPQQPTPDWLEMFKQQQKVVAQAAQQQQVPGPQEKKEGKPRREPWIIKPTDISIKPEGNGNGKEQKELSKEKKDELGRVGEAAGLIKPAAVAVPKYPLKTLYRSQVLVGRTLDEINSDIPGQVRVATTIPTFDKFDRTYEIVPKESIVIAVQKGKAEFGQSRLNMEVEQLEFPNGEVVSLKSSLGSEQGANGVTGKVNAHLGKLLLAAGISAVLNIGVRTAAGTPNQGYYFQNPAQQAAQDIGQSVQKDAQSYMDKVLRIPPTIVVKVGTPVTINLSENVTFSRKPIVVR